MRKYLTREQAIFFAGKENVEKLDKIDCEATNSVQPDGVVEFKATISYRDEFGLLANLSAYYYQDADDLNGVEALDQLSWEIDSYEIE